MTETEEATPADGETDDIDDAGESLTQSQAKMVIDDILQAVDGRTVREVQVTETKPSSPFDMGKDQGPEGEETWRFRVQGSTPLGDPSPALIEKVCEARQNIGTIPKSGYNSHIDHEYSTYDDVNGAVAEPLAEADVWVHSSIVDTYKQPSGTTGSGNQRWCVTAVMEVYLTDGDSRMGRRVVGENENAGDKHHYALESQLLRYALSKMLLLESGDVEVDADPGSGQGTQQSQSSTGQDPSGPQLEFIQDLREECRNAGVPTSAGEMEDDANPFDSNAMRGKPRTMDEAGAMIEKLQGLKEKATLGGGSS
ncbi:hypothetical protein BRD56_02535 [Thermoplasmatales archaeon SW_10_69_26]|nr:MAG: hypothetical protein BRD56_02535 [Thermoplasmatales archaeon SW_10_69_26]